LLYRAHARPSLGLLNPVLALTFSRVHQAVGGLKQLLRSARQLGKADESDAAGDGTAICRTQTPKRLPETIDQRSCFASLRLGHEHDELIAAEARDAIDATHDTSQETTELAQHAIALQMTEAVVDRLEVVDVEVSRMPSPAWQSAGAVRGCPAMFATGRHT
jgi:acetylornithine/succinyldiaminopimelate/putrescine aminotransferase